MISLKAIEHSRWRNGSLSLAAVDDQLPYDESVVGCIDLYDYDPLNHRCAVGIAVMPQYRHKGYATQMLKVLNTFAKNNLSLHQLFADIVEYNGISLRLFEHAGYIQCGHMFDWVAKDDGTYANAFRLQKVLD